MKKFFADFKKFITRGNVMDMAVGVIIASAFTAIVTALTNKIIMPCINWLLSLSGTNGLESAYTFLKKVIGPDGTVDLTKSIYIDWGAFITAIINFFLIAFVLFTILRVFMKTQGFLKKSISDQPTKAERKELKQRGVNVKDYKVLLAATQELRKEKKEKEDDEKAALVKPTTEELLQNILVELKKQNASVQDSEQNKEEEKK